MKTRFFPLLVLAASAAAQSLPGGRNYELTPERLSFRYHSHDGERSARCSWKMEFAAGQDLRVHCSGVGDFAVHLWISGYTRSVAPLASYEILYWIRDPRQADGGPGGPSSWMHLNEASSLHSLSVSQSVEGDLAALVMEYRL